MQHRMKTHQLSDAQIEHILKSELVGTLATINKDGTPYVTPMHFVYEDGKIYMHGLPAGQKVENLKSNNCVCFNVYHMSGLLLDPDEKPCDTNTAYQSVIIKGIVEFVTDNEAKLTALERIIEKYTPQLAGKTLPDNMVKGTAVICIEALEMTGKYWD